jgi:hypothetical protein
VDSKEAEASLGIQLLTDLQLVFEEEVELPSKTILERLHALPESPWADLHGKPLDQRNYGVKSGRYR